MVPEGWKLVEDSGKKGGQGYIKKVQCTASGIFGALKQQNDSNRKVTERRYRMDREAAVLAVMQGSGTPNLIMSNTSKFMDKSVDLYILMEWVEGKTLEEMASQNAMSVDDSLKFVHELLNTLDHCHSLEIFHRDLKPDNIMLRDQKCCSPVLIDFGMSKAPAENAIATPKAQDIGNRFYKLPEHMSGQSKGDHRSDLAMAIALLFFALFGSYPRMPVDQDGNPPHRRPSLKPSDELQKDERWGRLQGLFDIGFQNNIALRFQSVEQIRNALEELTPTRKDETVMTLKNELQAFKDRLISEGIATAEEQTAATLEINRALDQKLRTLFRPSGLGLSSNSLRLSNSSGSELRAELCQLQATQPSVPFKHRLEMDGIDVVASTSIEDENPVEYYRGPYANTSRLEQEVNTKQELLALELITRLRSKLGF